MRKTYLILLVMACLYVCISYVGTTEVIADTTLTQEDRERIIRTEARMDEGFKALSQRVEEGFKALSQRIDDTNRRFDDLKGDTQKQIEGLKSDTQRQFDQMYALMLWGFGILFGGMGTLIGFVIWDRRSTLSPAIRKQSELETREERIEKVLREMAVRDPLLRETLKVVGLL